MQMIVIAIAAIVLAVLEPVYRLLADPRLVFAAAAGVTLLPCILAAIVARRAIRALEADPADPNHGQYSFGRGMLITQTVLGVGHAALLAVTDWLPLCHTLPRIGHWPLVGELAALTPFVLSVLLMWTSAYPADRAIRQIAVELYLFRGKPTRPVWDLAHYLLFNLRHQVLFILVPMLLVLAARDVIESYEPRLERILPGGFLPDFLLGCVTVVVAVIAPDLLRHIWTTRRLPDGPLRDKLVVLCRKLKLRYREILVWRSGGMLVNAAVMGVIAPFRYVLVTDGMLEQMDDRKIEAVFGHEAGHVKRHHILFFLLFALISGSLFTAFSIRFGHRGRTPYEVATILGAALFLKWSLLFGWISRKFERQADLFGVKTLALTELPCAAPCALHGRLAIAAEAGDEQQGAAVGRTLDPSATAPARDWGVPPGEISGESRPDRPRIPASGGSASFLSAALVSSDSAEPAGERLCSTAAHLFGDTLYQVAHLNGIPPEARSWRHGSIASRSRTLQRYAADPLEVARFERHVYWIKAAIFVIALASSLWAGYELKLWRLVNLFTK